MTVDASSYRPENVTVVEVEPWYPGGPRFEVRDFDGTPLQRFTSRSDADDRARNRRGVIRAALTRRANKAKKSQIQGRQD